MMTLSEKRLFFLEGKWTFNRSTNGFGHMTGRSSFLPTPDALSTFAYQETGLFVTLLGVNLPFYKEYIYCLNKGMIEVYFASDRKKQGFFYALAFSSPNKATGSHQCRDDLYEASYTFLDDTTFTLQYDIEGPKKHISIETIFKREGS
jgi:hypothetical protein